MVSRPRIAVVGQRAVEPRERRRAVRAVGDHLGDHRVVVGADDAAGLDRGVDAHAARVARRAGPGRRTGRSCASSAFTRASIAWPVIVTSTSSGSPAATRSCSSTRSSPVTSSVTGCSTCSRAFISRKKCVDGIVGVGDELDRAGAVVARGLRQRDRLVARASRAARRRRPATATPRSPSGGAAAASTRARRARARCRACRRSPAPRCAARAAGSARGTRGRRRSPPAASRRAAAIASSRSSARSTTRIPRPPPPAAALTSTGYSTVSRRVASGRSARRPRSAASFARTLSPISSIASGDGPTNTTPASAHARASAGFSDRKP